MNFTPISRKRHRVWRRQKLAKLIEEVEQLFPLHNGISVQSECPIGLIGDDIEAVPRRAPPSSTRPIVPVRCEGFRGVSQSLGHHIANDAIRDWVLDKRDGKAYESTPYDVAIIGDYNIGGDAWATRVLLKNGPARGGPVVGRRHPAEMMNTPRSS